MLTLVIVITLSVLLSLLLLRLDNKLADRQNMQTKLVEEVNQILPQTQCGECGYTGCRPYAEAMVNHGVDISLCPPGGGRTQNKLALILGKSNIIANNHVPTTTIANIDPEVCIGCVKCIKVCPVDAIVGAAKQLHMVIPSLCTGCELCIPPCPVDCISMTPSPQAQWQWTNPAPEYQRVS